MTLRESDLDDLRRAFVDGIAAWMDDQRDPRSDKWRSMRSAARALLARIEASKGASTEPPMRPSRSAEDVLIHGIPVPDTKPEPPKQRTAEEILGKLATTLQHSGWKHRNEWGNDADEALRLVRELRQERDALLAACSPPGLCANFVTAYDRNRRLEAERDELQRRIEKAIAHERTAYGGNDPIIRILEGKE